MPRISEIEIIGRNRTNKKIKLINKPIVPMNIDQSQNVGLYIAQDDGRKSRCRLGIMIMNLSSHIPTSTTSDITQSSTTLCRTFLIHRTCGITTLQKISDQYIVA